MDLPLEARALFRELIDYCYCGGRGSLPNNPNQIQRIADCTEAEFQRSWPLVKSHFYEQDGRLRNRKTDEVVKKLLEFDEKKAAAGRESGRKRRERMYEMRSTHVEQMFGTNLIKLSDSEGDIERTHVQHSHSGTYVEPSPSPSPTPSIKPDTNVKVEVVSLAAAAPTNGHHNNGNGFHWKQAAAAVQKDYPQTEDSWISRLAELCQQAIQHAGGDPAKLTDTALRDAIVSSKKRSQHSAALYKKTVPVTVANWSKGIL
jgi:uncharacterized protein YdaU (DUF1376 family)